MKVGLPYKRAQLDGPWDCIVIGSGMGGLTTAALLSKHAGQRVLVLEQHYTAGGYTHVFQRPEYEWDVGVHYIGDVLHPRQHMRRVFDQITDGRLEWADLGEVYDRIIIGEDHYDLVKGRARFRQRLCEYFPQRAGEIDLYLERVRAAVRASQLYYADKVLPGPLSATVGRLLRLPALRHASRTTADVLAEITDDPQLRAVLAGQWGDYGLPPSQSCFLIHALVVEHYLSGAAYPVGGSSSIARCIEPLITAAGGQIVTSASVAEILCERGRARGVRLADGTELVTPRIVSTAGAHLTLTRLLPRDVAHDHGLLKPMAAVEPSCAHMSLYLGFEATAEELQLGKTNLWVYPDADYEGALQRFMADREAPLPFAYLSFPSAKDPDFARRYPGKATVEVVAPANYDHFQQWETTRWHKRGADYDAFKQRLTERMLKRLFAQCPQLQGRVAYSELSTPLSTRHFAAYERGEIYGLAHTPKRFAQRWLRPRTPIDGLYMAGADVVSAGVCGAMMSGVLCATSIAGQRVFRAAMQGTPERARAAVASLDAA